MVGVKDVSTPLPSSLRLSSVETVIVECSVVARIVIDELTVKSFDSPDETVTFANGRSEGVRLDRRTFWLTRVEPGWVFSRDNAPELGTDSCPEPHRLYVVSGRMTVEMDGGDRETLARGDVALIPPGHDAWVVGDEPAVFFEEAIET